MSDYDYDQPRRYKNSRTRPARTDEPEYVEETTYVQKGRGPPPRDLVYRSRDRDDSPDDGPPPSSGRGGTRSDYDAPRRRARSAGGDRRSYYDDDDDGYAAAGAAGGYAAGRRGDRGYDRGYDRDDDDRRYSRGGRGDRDAYSDVGRRSRSRSRSRDEGGIKGILEGLGLGGIIAAATGKSNDRNRSKSRTRGGRDGSRDRTDRKGRQWAQAAQAAVVAGAIEAYRARKEPGPWLGGEKGKRIATAAIGAGGIDRLVDRDPNEKSKRHIAEAVLGGLAANRLANGPRTQDRDPDLRGRSRSRSQSVFDRFRSKSRGVSGSRSRSRGPGDEGGNHSNVKAALAGGGIAAAGKYIYDRVRDKSRGGEGRRRSPSASSEDSYVPSRSRRGDRGRDVGDPYSQSRALPPSGPGNPDEQAVAPRAPGAGQIQQTGPGSYRKGEDEVSSSESDTSIENKRKKMRGKEYITAALATVATIHAAHGVYNSMEKSSQRHKLVQEGEISKEEARKQKAKARLQDAAAIGIAALGIKGAYSEWKEMNEHRHTLRELEEKRRKRMKRRQKQGLHPGFDGRPPQPIGYGQGYDSYPPANGGFR